VAAIGGGLHLTLEIGLDEGIRPCIHYLGRKFRIGAGKTNIDKSRETGRCYIQMLAQYFTGDPLTGREPCRRISSVD
ncbi:hypothetical protein LTR94_036694, partial [Friedmanniomyces endolithicus]